MSGVGTYALCSLDDVLAYLGARPDRDGFWIYCSAAGATAASAQVSATTLTLIITGGGSAGTTTFSLTNALYDTLAELVAAINAVAGWKAGLLAAGATTSTDLLTAGPLACNGDANEVTLQVKDNYAIERLIDRATDIIERYCHRRLLSRSYTREVYDGNGRERMLLREYPVTVVARIATGRSAVIRVTNTAATTKAMVRVSATKVTLSRDAALDVELTISASATMNDLITAINAVGNGWAAVLDDAAAGSVAPSELLPTPGFWCKSPTNGYLEMTDDNLTDFYIVDPDEARNAGVIHAAGGFVEGVQNIVVDYTAGYTTTPEALKQACVDLVVWKYGRASLNPAVGGETLGDYAYTLRDVRDGLTEEVRAGLEAFKRFVL